MTKKRTKKEQMGFKQALEIIIKKLKELHREELILEIEKLRKKLL